jgi:SagB-type dehydrogenase family enzyme
MSDSMLDQGRFFLKDTIRKQVDFRGTDQSRGLPPPPAQKPVPDDAVRLDLPPLREAQAKGKVALAKAIGGRRSHRQFTTDPLSDTELAWLLWATQGVSRQLTPSNALRVVPSAGCRHALETYLAVKGVDGLAPGLYRFLPLDWQLARLRRSEDIALDLALACFRQAFIASAPVTFVWTALPDRMEWRYGAAAHKVIALDAGHVCQNLYLACEAVGAGTCAIAAYDQQAVDQLLGVDGGEEFAVYLAPVGKV